MPDPTVLYHAQLEPTARARPLPATAGALLVGILITGSVLIPFVPGEQLETLDRTDLLIMAGFVAALAAIPAALYFRMMVGRRNHGSIRIEREQIVIERPPNAPCRLDHSARVERRPMPEGAELVFIPRPNLGETRLPERHFRFASDVERFLDAARAAGMRVLDDTLGAPPAGGAGPREAVTDRTDPAR